MELIAKKRELQGKKVKKLRLEGLLPCVLYGKTTKSTSLKVNLNAFVKVLNAAGESSLIDLFIDESKTPRKILISNVQYSPVTDTPIHADLHEVNLKEKITANIPVEIIGESPAVKANKGILLTLIDEIEVECLPTDIPKCFEVNVSNLNEVDDFMAVKDLEYDKDKINIELDPEELIIKVDYAEQLEEKEEEAPSVEDVEVTGEKPEEEKGKEGGKGKEEEAPKENKEKANEGE